MAKSLFGKNKNSGNENSASGNMVERYRNQNEAAIRQDRANELDDKISELSAAKRTVEWANATIELYESVMLNDDIFDILINLALIKRMKTEAENFLQKQKDIAATAIKNKKAAEEAAAKQRIADYEDSISALAGAPKTERWCKDVEALSAEINSLTIKERAKIRNAALLEELEGVIALVRRAAEISHTITTHAAKAKQDVAWAKTAVDIEESIPLNVREYLKNPDELSEMVNRARSIISTDKKQKKTAAIEKAAADQAERERLAEIERQRREALNAEVQVLRDKIRATKEGKSITFGSYVQNGSAPEPIEWTLVWKNGPVAVLLSKNILDAHEYNDITDLYYQRNRYIPTAQCGPDLSDMLRWDKSSLRAWLNGEFYNTAFTEAEKMIITSSHTVSSYGKSLSVTTNDRVVVPSFQEMNHKFFKKKKNLIAKATPFAIRKGSASDKKKRGCWWTRDTYTGEINCVAPGGFCSLTYDLYSIYVIGSDGKLSANQHNSSRMEKEDAIKANQIQKAGGVRPLIEVSME